MLLSPCSACQRATHTCDIDSYGIWAPCADGTVLPIAFPTGILNVSPSNTPSTSYNAGTDTWTTYQTVAPGATSLSTVSFITGSMTGLPRDAQVLCFCHAGGCCGAGEDGLPKGESLIAFGRDRREGFRIMGSTADHVALPCIAPSPRSSEQAVLIPRFMWLSVHLAELQVSSVKIFANFTVVQGLVSKLGWMFRQDTYKDADQQVRL